jgi:hypothetical protein
LIDIRHGRFYFSELNINPLRLAFYFNAHARFHRAHDKDITST